MSSVLKVLLLGVIGVFLFFVGLAVGIVSDSDERDPYQAPSVVADAGETPIGVPTPVPPRVIVLPSRIYRVPAPYAIADEQIGAYRVNGFVTFLGPTRIRLSQQQMACFPLER